MSAAALTDAELGCLALGGDRAALAEVFERHRPALYASAIGLLNSRVDAQDAVQDTFLIALLRLGGVRDVVAIRGWLHAVLRNVCLMRIRRRRETPTGVVVELPDVAPGPEEALEAHVLRECIWHALDTLSPEERLTVVLRHFSRCTSYTAIGAVTAVPVGTVRSRLNRARTRLLEALLATPHDPPLRHAELESARREHWESFYQMVQERPVPLTYRDLFTPDVEVRDTGGCWHGIDDWSAEERAAITVGVRATVVGLLAGPDLTVVEVDFHNPAEWPDHCPPQATFVHRLRGGRSWGLRIHYPGVATTG